MRKGFSLFDTMVSVAIIGVAVAAAQPSIARMQARQNLRDAGQEIVAQIRRARSLARSRQSGFAGWTADMVVRQAGVQILDKSVVKTYVDGDYIKDDKNEVAISAYTIDPQQTMEASQTSFRFRRNGTLTTNDDVEITLTDKATQVSLTIRVAFGGEPALQF